MALTLESWQERLCSVMEPEGAELLEVHFMRRRNSLCLRFFVDRNQGLSIDDIARLSRGISLLLDEDPTLAGRYELEVSSPGMNRVVRTEAHFRRFVGERVHLKTFEERGGRRIYEGTIQGCESGVMTMMVDGVGPMDFELGRIERAELRLDPRRPPRGGAGSEPPQAEGEV